MIHTTVTSMFSTGPATHPMMVSQRAFSDAPHRRVLIADDNAEMRAFIRRLLADRYDVEVVAGSRAFS